MIPSERWTALTSVPGLKEGHTTAPDYEEREAVNRPLRKLKTQPINRDNIIVIGDLEESKRRAIAYAKQIGLIRDKSAGDA